eukprot:NODE_181_length_15774_cov_0.163892.p1 type:complete len:1708 gc:universal NODE_181_length_15774_cov_0.163892:10148-5025(-)
MSQMELLDPLSDPQLIVSQHIMNIQQNKYASLEARLTLPKLFAKLLPDLKSLLNTSTTLINMLDSKDITLSTTCLIIDILDAILINAPYQAQTLFSTAYYKLIKNYKSNTLLYHLVSMDCMHYLELDDNNTLSLYRILRGFMHSEIKKIKLKAIQQYYIFCIQNHSVITKSIKIFSILDIFLDRNMVISHMIREQSSIALSTLLYFYSKQVHEEVKNEDNNDEDTEKNKKPAAKIEQFTESDVFPAIFRNMELALLERDYIAYLSEVLGRYCQLKGKLFMEQNYSTLIQNIAKLLSCDAFNKLYFSDQYFIFSCISFILRKDVSSLLTHDDGFMPAINVLLEYLEQWPQLTPNKPIPSNWTLSICILELGNYITLAGTNVGSFDNLQTILFRYLEHSDDVLINGALYCMHGIMQSDASYVRSLVTVVYPFLKDDLPKLKSMQPDVYLKKYHAYSMALMVVLVYWSEHYQMTSTDVDLILKIVNQAINFVVENDSMLLVQELVRNSGWQILSYLMDIAEINMDIEQDVIMMLMDVKPLLVVPPFPINETFMLKCFTTTTSCLRFIRKCLSKQSYNPLFLESIAELLELYLVMVEQLPSLFGAMSITTFTSLRTNVLQNLNDRELMFRTLVLESTVLLSKIHKNGKSLLIKHSDAIFKKHARFIFQLEYDICSVEQHNTYYKSRSNGSFLGTVLHFLDHLPKATPINLNSDQYLELYRISSDTHVKLFYFELDLSIFNKLSFKTSLITHGSSMPFMRCISSFCKFIQIALPLSDVVIQRQLINTCSIFLTTIDLKSTMKRKTAFIIFASLLGGTETTLDAVAAFNAYKLLLQYTSEVFTDIPHLINELLSLFGTSLDASSSSAIIKDLLDKTISNPDVDKRHYQFIFLTSLIKKCTVIDHMDVLINVMNSLLLDTHPLAHASGLIGCTDVISAPFMRINNKFIDLYLGLYNNLNYEEYFILNDVLGVESDGLYLYHTSSILQSICFNLGTELFTSPFKSKLMDLSAIYINNKHPFTSINALNIFEFLISFKMTSNIPFTSESLLQMFRQSMHSDLRFVILKLLKHVVVNEPLSLPLQVLIMATEDVINTNELLILRQMCTICIDNKRSYDDLISNFNLLKSILNKQQQQTTITMNIDDEGLQMIQKQSPKSTIIPSFNSLITAAQCFMQVLQLLKQYDLIDKIQDLIAISFNCSTSSNMELKFYGLLILQDCLLMFEHVKDPQDNEHVILEQYHAQFTSALSPMFNSRSPDDLIASACLVNSTFIISIKDVILIDKPVKLLNTVFSNSLAQLKTDTISNVLLIATMTCYLEVYEFINQAELNHLLDANYDVVLEELHVNVLPVLCKQMFQKNNLFKSRHLNNLQFQHRWIQIVLSIISSTNSSNSSTTKSLAFGLLQSHSCSFNTVTPLHVQMVLKMQDIDILSEESILIDYFNHSSQMLFKIAAVGDKIDYLSAMLRNFKSNDLGVEYIESLFNVLIYHMQIQPQLYIQCTLMVGCLLIELQYNVDEVTSKCMMSILIGYKHITTNGLQWLKKATMGITIDTLGWLIYKVILNKLILEVNEVNMIIMLSMIHAQDSVIEHKITGITMYFIHGINMGDKMGIYGIQGIKMMINRGINTRIVIASIVKMLLRTTVKGMMLEDGFVLLMSVNKRKGYLLLLNMWKQFRMMDGKKMYMRLIQIGLPEHMGLLKTFLGKLDYEERSLFQRLLS